jgi:segregation and condensation protein A
MFKVELEKFSGPLGLLLNMIEKEKLDITEISLAKIADNYVAHIKSLDNIVVDEVADFLVTASKLLWLKSKALLPYLRQEEEEDLDELENQLKMYKEFREASLEIAKLISLPNNLFVPKFNRLARRKLFNLPLFVAPKNIDIEKLNSTMIEIIESLEKEEILEVKRVKPEVSLEEKIISIRGSIKQKSKVYFHNLLKDKKSKTEIIVSVLAVLELIKQHEIIFEQEKLFADIYLSKI